MNYLIFVLISVSVINICPTQSTQKQIKKNVKSAISLSGEPMEFIGVYDLRFDKKIPFSCIPEVPNDFFKENEDIVNILVVIKPDKGRCLALYYTNKGELYAIDMMESFPEIERFLHFLPEPYAI